MKTERIRPPKISGHGLGFETSPCSEFLEWSLKAGYGTCTSDIQLALWDAWRAGQQEDKRRLDGLEAIPHQLEIVCKQSRPKAEGLPTLRQQIDFFLSNDSSNEAQTNQNTKTETKTQNEK